MPTLSLACDGPLNGQYITPAQAAQHGYELIAWPTGELVYILEDMPLTF